MKIRKNTKKIFITIFCLLIATFALTTVHYVAFAEDIKIYIGEENEKEELKDFSVVTFKHKVDSKEMGTIGIIGPKRMDYAKVISVMKYISKKLNEEK